MAAHGQHRGFFSGVASVLFFAVVAIVLVAPTQAQASNVQFVGTVSYSFAGNIAELTADQVSNFDSGGFSGTLRVELWALSAPYSGSNTVGYKMATYTLGQLTAGFHFSNVDSGAVSFIQPPDGTWWFTLLLTEYTAGPLDDGYTVRDYRNFSSPVTFGNPPPIATAIAVEYHHVLWDHYFVTASTVEINALDAGAFGGVWQRTGYTFLVWTQSTGLSSPTCRFFSTGFPPKSTHFYTPFASECNNLMSDPNWQFEAIAFHLQLASIGGICGAGTFPLYRLFNNFMGGAPNHRYTTSATVFNQMIAAGWTFEGNATTKVFACVPQ